MGGLFVNVQFKKGVLELCVLVLLDKKDRYGYELVQKSLIKLKYRKVRFIRYCDD